MKQRKHNWLALAYLAAALVWLVLGGWQLARQAWYSHKGLAVSSQVEWQQLEQKSLVELQQPQPGIWYVSTDSDPQLIYRKSLYLNQVVLRVEHRSPSDAVVLYWTQPGQSDYSARQMVYGQQVEPGVYRFDLGGQLVDSIRIDPDSRGGVITRFDGLELNPSTPWYEASRLTNGQLLALVLLALVAAAAAGQLASWFEFSRKEP